ncbi:hypothetical protein Tco_0600700 [Tanacetum coccineum]
MMTFPPSMRNTNDYPIDKSIRTSNGLAIGTVTGRLPTKYHQRGRASLQITGATTDGIDPYSLKTCDILGKRHGKKWYTDHIGIQYLAGESGYRQITIIWVNVHVYAAIAELHFGNAKKLPLHHILLSLDTTNAAIEDMFSMTLLGANVDKSVNNGRGPYVFRISGQLYHWIGSLCPKEGQSPMFMQLYIYDTTNELKNWLSHFSDERQSELKEEIVEGLIEFLDTHNALVQLFRTARNKHTDADVPEFKVRLYNVIGTRQYELPTSETIGAIVFGDSSTTENEFDLIIE